MIGVFDSGAGGLTVVKELTALLPKTDLVYFGDTARFPYGNQSAEQLQHYAEEDAALLIKEGADAIVIACHSASAAAGDYLRTKFKQPVFDVNSTAAAEALRVSRRGRIGVIGTKATIASGVYQRLLAGEGRIITAVAAPMLVPLVEERWWKYPESMKIIRRSLLPLKKAHVDTLVLACTHYPIIEPYIRRAMGKSVKLVNPARATAQAVQRYCEEHPEPKAGSGTQRFFVSADPEHFKATAQWWLGKKIEVAEAKANKV